MNSAAIHKALRELYPPGAHAYIQEFRAGTGYSDSSNRYLDAWIISCFPSSGLVRTAIEIKISRSDFTRELKQPMKRDSALRLCNEFYFAAPKNLIGESELPDEAGLIEVDPLTGKATVKHDAPYRETSPATWAFVASLARRMADYRPTSPTSKEELGV